MPDLQPTGAELLVLQWEYERPLRPDRPRKRDASVRWWGSDDVPRGVVWTVHDSGATVSHTWGAVSLLRARKIRRHLSLYILVLCLFLSAYPVLSYGSGSGSSALCPQMCRCFIENATFTLASNASGKDEIVTDCSSAGLSTWPGVLPRTTVLLLDNNKLRRLENVSDRANRTNDVVWVGTLSLTHNLVSYINKRAFDGFQSLTTLLLHHNILEDVQWTLGLADKQVTLLDLSHNSISRISPDSLEPLSFLKRLNISHNSITVVQRNSFLGFSNLESLDLSANALRNGGLQQHAFSRAVSLKHLSLAGNRGITRIPNFMDAGLDDSALETLDMNDLPLLLTVDSFAFRGLAALRTLNLSRCSIDTLSQGWLNGGPERTLQTLDLSHNRISQIDPYSLVSVTASMRFSEPSAFTSLPSETASLSYVVSPSVGVPVQQITPIFASDGSVPLFGSEWYEALESLQWLSLANNRRLSLLAEDAFAHLPSLRFLFLQNCNITRINIASQKYQISDQAVKLTLPNLTSLWLYNNPIYCDCYVKQIRHVIKTSNDSGCALSNSRWWGGSPPDYLLLDPETYVYDGQCLQVAGVKSSICYLTTTTTQVYRLQDVPVQELRCAIEPMSWFITLLIGPLAFAVSIGATMLCGSCSVMVRRVRRYQSGKYHVMDEKNAFIMRDRAVASNLRLRAKAHRHQQSPSSKMTRWRSSNVPRYGTNMVLSSMSHTASSEGTLHLPSILSARPPQPRSRSPSPSARRPMTAFLSVPQRHYKETSFGSDQYELSSKSCPDVSNLEKSGVKFWKHEAKSHANIPSGGAEASGVGCADVHLPLLGSAPETTC